MPKKEIKVEIVAETKNAEGKLATVSAALKSVANDAARASKQAGKIDDSGMKKMASSADGATKRVKSLGDALSKVSAMFREAREGRTGAGEPGHWRLCKRYCQWLAWRGCSFH